MRPLGRVPLRQRAVWLLPLAWLVIVAAPLYYVVETSLRSPTDYLVGNPWLPSSWTLDNYARVLSGNFSSYLLNSVFVTAATVGLQTAIGLPAAYAIVRSRSRVGGTALTVLLIGLAIPAQAALIPLFFMMTRLGLYDTLAAVVLPIVAFNVPITVLILVTYLRDIPTELWDAVEVDGAGPWRALTAIALPLGAPALGTIGIYNALSAWNSFLFPLILTQSDAVRVIPVGLFAFKNDHGIAVTALLAAVILSAAPLLLAYLVGRRQLLRGLAAISN
jgi:ABC-type glycerol-3-phosphate transport system permease component